MAKRTKFTPKQTPDGWRINIPAKFSQSGKRERHFYPTREKADAAAKILRDSRDSFGAKAIGISPSLAEMATAAAALLEPYGITILDAARKAAEAAENERRSELVESAVAAYLVAKEGRSAAYMDTVKLMAKRLGFQFAGRPLSSISGSEILDHLSEESPGAATFNLRRRVFSAFWNWCARPPREWCDRKAMLHVDVKESGRGEIGILTAKECRKLLLTAEKHFPDTVSAFAIMLFTGMRSEELERLEPSDIREDGISVPAAKAKTKRRRFIQMPTPLAAWLKAYPVADVVSPANWERKFCAVRRLAGWRVWCDMIDPPKPPDSLPAWPRNALRHTAATMALALGKPLETLVFEHGHAGDLDVLRNHYIGQMPRKEAVAIWAIGPRGSTLKAIHAA